ncbi:MAG: orotidine-5'-phosphate decarboxylase [Actinomycetota bacterium]|nr:orotidine-5'-phosphate decarboxylase [Actinomycetota bacterium]
MVALDVADLAIAEQLARRLAGAVGFFKVGLELFSRYGPLAVERIGWHGQVFLDLKLHDIPATVGRSARQLGPLRVAMLSVHASGGPAMVKAAVEGLAEGGVDPGARSLVVAVTVLTSLEDGDLATLGLPAAPEQAPRLARVAIGAGAAGVVCAPRHLSAVRAEVGSEPVVVTPGVRPASVSRDDHAHAATPEEAVAGGADFIVVGRPVTAADDPVKAARSILAAVGSRAGGT